ncbi:hypothetical protein PR048_033333 [Dryococelus australis]|uniref:aspartate transaminase n=1 Tax=Dryococelus australis TaxID=614101 RepID=A0ABQ9G2U9_9NEOP|nr:hypothetical protein PR048_033333 [Dryococelus australis]
MRVIEGEYGVAQELNGGGGGGREIPGKASPTNGIVRHDSHLRKSGSDPARDRTRIALPPWSLHNAMSCLKEPLNSILIRVSRSGLPPHMLSGFSSRKARTSPCAMTSRFHEDTPVQMSEIGAMRDSFLQNTSDKKIELLAGGERHRSFLATRGGRRPSFHQRGAQTPLCGVGMIWRGGGEIPEKTCRPNGIVRHDSHLRKSGVTQPGIGPRFALVGGEQASRSATAGHYENKAAVPTGGGGITGFWNAIFVHLASKTRHKKTKKLLRDRHESVTTTRIKIRGCPVLITRKLLIRFNVQQLAEITSLACEITLNSQRQRSSYRHHDGLPWVPPAVREAEMELHREDPGDHQYMYSLGDNAYRRHASQLVLGADSPALLEGRVSRAASTCTQLHPHQGSRGNISRAVVCCQSFGGGCALSMGARYLSQILKYTTVYFSSPTWSHSPPTTAIRARSPAGPLPDSRTRGIDPDDAACRRAFSGELPFPPALAFQLNHAPIFMTSGFKDVRYYRYWSDSRRNLDFDGMIQDLREAPQDAVVVLQGCAHNPTGMDLSQEQWRLVADVVQERKLLPFIDNAYQGFASGDLDADVWQVRYFVQCGIELLYAQSFSKNMGLYGEHRQLRECAVDRRASIAIEPTNVTFRFPSPVDSSGEDGLYAAPPSITSMVSARVADERIGSLIVVANDLASISNIAARLENLERSMYVAMAQHGCGIVVKLLQNDKLRAQW